ncbi:MAG: GSCFA domain-containing protein, partial [Bacteroidales bacterium]|nr:GSCFA domain-containing protein [Bacteroidales bacterium]
MQRQSQIVPAKAQEPISPGEGVLSLGSCFSTVISDYLGSRGYRVCANPFGTLFNPLSIASSLERLCSGTPFTGDDCIRMGAGSTLWCSLHHYTKFARETPEDFLMNANSALEEACHFWRGCRTVIITFGTAFCFRHLPSGIVAANCLKRDSREFERFRLEVEDIVSLWRPLIASAAGRRFIFTVSPIRHLADGAHANQVSKATLLLAVERLVCEFPENCFYFPSYEILLDELRDFSWYAQDTVHPSSEAQGVILKRF